MVSFCSVSLHNIEISGFDAAECGGKIRWIELLGFINP